MYSTFLNVKQTFSLSSQVSLKFAYDFDEELLPNLNQGGEGIEIISKIWH
jgi:hypothetical protein